jgi:ADP-dependent NAD(P)H-hydrate dehydratase
MKNARIDATYLRSNPLPRHDESSDKHARGRVLVVAGSIEVPGAALLAGLGALRSGAGVLQIATCQSNVAQLGMAIPEAMVVGCRETSNGDIDPSNFDRLADIAQNADAVLIGPGMLDETSVGELRAELVSRATNPVFILDAAAFTSLKRTRAPSHPSRIIVTPHSGEMAKFLEITQEEVRADPLAAARRAAESLRATVAMKGARTYVVSIEGNVLFCDHGSIALATSGSGDVLAGILSGLSARGTPPLLATAWAVFMHGEAGRRWVDRNGPLGLLAHEIPTEIPSIMKSLA